MHCDAYLVFVQKHKANDHYVDVPPNRTIFEETGNLGGRYKYIITYY